MHNEIEFSFTNLLIFALGLGVSYWMSRAPRSVLKLMNNRYPSLELDQDRPWRTSIVRNFGRFTFFMLINSTFLMCAPASALQYPGSSLAMFVQAFAITWFALGACRTRTTPPR